MNLNVNWLFLDFAPNNNPGNLSGSFQIINLLKREGHTL